MNIYISVSDFFYEEHKILCECLYKCFLVFMRSIKYLVNVYGSVSYFFYEEHKIPCECLYKCFIFV